MERYSIGGVRMKSLILTLLGAAVLFVFAHYAVLAGEHLQRIIAQ